MTVFDVLPLIVLIVALWFGPLPIVARGFVRRIAGPHHVHRWYAPVGFGIAIGAGLAAVGALFLIPGQTTGVVLLVLLFLLASIDWQWRWLPIEWTLSIAALALIHGMASQDIVLVLKQMLIPCLILAGFRLFMSKALGKEALGLGDIWLLLGLGGFLSIFETFLVVGLAAVLGLLEVTVRYFISGGRPNTTGVSYGTHLCIVFLIFRSFPQII